MQAEKKRREKQNMRYLLSFILLLTGVFTFLVLNICVGSVKLSLQDVWNSFRGMEVDITVIRIIWGVRFPRAVAALILGGALALSGYLLQTFFHNPIASPFVLGISSGAKMVVALVMVFLMGRAMQVSSAALIVAAFLGAMLSMGFVLIMSKKVNQMSTLIVSGVMIGYICSAITELVVTFADDAEIVNLHNWSNLFALIISVKNIQIDIVRLHSV